MTMGIIVSGRTNGMGNLGSGYGGGAYGLPDGLPMPSGRSRVVRRPLLRSNAVRYIRTSMPVRCGGAICCGDRRAPEHVQWPITAAMGAPLSGREVGRPIGTQKSGL